LSLEFDSRDISNLKNGVFLMQVYLLYENVGNGLDTWNTLLGIYSDYDRAFLELTKMELNALEEYHEDGRPSYFVEESKVDTSVCST
jgi:hypothetical protein